MFLRGLLRSLERRWGTVLSVTALVTAAGTALLPSSPFLFRAEARIHLSSDAPGAEDFVLSDPVLERTLGYPRKAELDRFRSSLEVRRRRGSTLITVSASAGWPSRAVEHANGVAASFQRLYYSPRRDETEAALEILDLEIGERRRALAEMEKSRAATEDAPAADPHVEIRKARAAALLEAEGLSARRELLAGKLEKGETGPARPVDPAASDRAAAAVESARRRLDDLRAIYPEDWPPVARAAADLERLRASHAQALNRESLEARFAPVRSLVDEVRELSRRKEAALLAAAQHEAVLTAAAPAAPRAVTRPEAGRRIEEASESLRDLVRRREKTALDLKLAPGRASSIDAASRAPLVSAPFPFVLGAGLLAGVLAACLREALVTTLRTEHDLRRTLNLPLLAVIPRRDAPAAGGSDEEAYATLAALLGGPAQPGQGRVHGVASAVAGEGKSTVAAGLASAFARSSVRTLLVDADLRRPVLHERFGIANETGLSTYLTGAVEAIEAAIVPTGIENLSLLPSGPPLESPVPYLRAERFKALVGELRGRFDIVVLDLPPVCRAADALFAAPLADGMILVVAAGESRKDDATLAKRLVRSVRGTWTGCVLNKAAGEPLGYYRYGPAAPAGAATQEDP